MAEQNEHETCIICLMGGLSVSYGVFVDEDRGKLLTLYWLPKLHKRPYKSRFIAKSRPSSTTDNLLQRCD